MPWTATALSSGAVPGNRRTRTPQPHVSAVDCNGITVKGTPPVVDDRVECINGTLSHPPGPGHLNQFQSAAAASDRLAPGAMTDRSHDNFASDEAPDPYVEPEAGCCCRGG
jgi:hypothetical protein